MEPTDRLESWKEIAAYLNRDVRTVQRWEASEELPVHRHQHKKRGSVYALRSELDTWRDSRRAELFEPAAEVPASPVVELRPVPRLAWAAAIVVVAAAAIGLAAWVRASAPTGVPLDPPGDAPRLFGEVLREGGRPQRIQLPGEVGDLALSPDGTTLYAAVCGPGVSAVHAVDLASRAIAWSVEGVAGCTRLVLSPRGERLLVADAPDILLVDTRTRAVERIVTPAATISDIVLTADGRTLYAAAAFGGLLAVGGHSEAQQKVFDQIDGRGVAADCLPPPITFTFVARACACVSGSIEIRLNNQIMGLLGCSETRRFTVPRGTYTVSACGSNGCFGGNTLGTFSSSTTRNLIC